MDKPLSELRLELLEQSGYGSFQSGQFAPAIRRYQDAWALAQQIPVSSERLADICAWLADASQFAGEFDAANQFVKQGLQILFTNQIPLGETQLRLELLDGVIQVRAGLDYEAAVQSLQKVLVDVDELKEPLRRDLIKPRALHYLANALSYLDRYAESFSTYRQAVELARKVGDKGLETASLLNIADDDRDLGRLEESDEWIAEGLKASHETGNLADEAFAMSLQAYNHLARGEYQAAAGELESALKLSEQIGAKWNLAVMRASLGEVYLGLNRLGDAEEAARLSLEIAAQDDSPFNLGYSHYVLGRVAAAREDWKAAEAEFKQAIDSYQKADDNLYILRARRGLAESLLKQGRRDEALQESQASYDGLMGFANKPNDPEGRKSVLENVPEHRDIITLWKQFQGEEGA